MIRSPETQTQLQTLANAADNANRPAMLVNIAGVLVVFAILFTLWSGARFFSAKHSLESELRGRDEVGTVLQQIAMRRQDTPDLEKLFPPQTYLAENINDVVLSVWNTPKENQASLPVKTTPRDGPTVLAGNPQLGRSEVLVTMNGQPIEKIMQFLGAVQEATYLKDVTFISGLKLTPMGMGWNAEIRFVAYEKMKR